LRDAFDWKKRGRELALYLGIGTFLAITNPYGATSWISFPLALLYWTSAILVGSLAGELISKAYNRLRPQGPLWPLIALGALGSAFAVTLFLVVIETIFRQGIPLVYVPRLYGLVLVIAVAITLIGVMVDRAFPDQTGSASPPKTSAALTFLQRLPVRFHSAELWAVSSEDHYCRVHTSLGSELVLMRLADADRELADADGLRVHRSWWVARKGVAAAERSDGRLRLKLHSGEAVPVSRSYQAAVKDAGFTA
jgi:hypothetical protein